MPNKIQTHVTIDVELKPYLDELVKDRGLSHLVNDLLKNSIPEFANPEECDKNIKKSKEIIEKEQKILKTWEDKKKMFNKKFRKEAKDKLKEEDETKADNKIIKEKGRKAKAVLKKTFISNMVEIHKFSKEKAKELWPDYQKNPTKDIREFIKKIKENE